MPDLLEFEEPIGVLQKEIEALSMLPPTPARESEIEGLRRRIASIRTDRPPNGSILKPRRRNSSACSCSCRIRFTCTAMSRQISSI